MKVINKFGISGEIYDLQDRNAIHPSDVSSEFNIENPNPVSSYAVNEALNSSNTATQHKNGLMSASDKAKLDGISEITGITILHLTVELMAENWTNTPPYQQTASCPGIEPTDKPVVDISLSDDSTTAMNQLNSYAKISKTITGNNNVTCIAFQQKPLTNITLNLLVVK